MVEQKSCFEPKNVWAKVVEQKSFFAPKMFEQKSCFAPIRLNKSLAFHPKLLNKSIASHQTFLKKVLLWGKKCLNKYFFLHQNCLKEIALLSKYLNKKEFFTQTVWCFALQIFEQKPCLDPRMFQQKWLHKSFDFHANYFKKSCFAPKKNIFLYF